MADPRFSLKQCMPPYATASNSQTGAMQTSSRSFFNSLGKIGDLNVLNDIGAGKLGIGLRTLAGISNTVKTGCGTIPSSIASTIESGADWVLGHMGIGKDVVELVQNFNPGVANRAYGQAKSIWQQVQQGNFHVQHIPGVIQDFIHLEQMSSRIYTPQSWLENHKTLPKLCEASPYALDLVRTAHVPKYKFLFVVQFVFNDGYSHLNQAASDLAFVVKKSTRPNIKFETTEVNYYNYNTPIHMKTSFEEMNMSFHDAGGNGPLGNASTRFINSYLRAVSPIANIGPDYASMSDFENRGMDFKNTILTGKNKIDGAIDSNWYAANVGPLLNNQVTVLREIMLYHVYDYGRQVNIYHFINPKITKLSQDDVDMAATTEACSVDITFQYDYVYTETNIDYTSIANRMSDVQGAAQYKMVNFATQQQAVDFARRAPDTPKQPNNQECGPLNTTQQAGSNSNTNVFDELNATSQKVSGLISKAAGIFNI